MENSSYLKVKTNLGGDHSSWKPFLRQLLVSSAAWTIYFTAGLWFGAPTVMIPQLSRDANITITDNMASWLSSALGYAAVPWIFVLSFLTEYIGRKRTFILVSLTLNGVFISFYFSDTVTHLLISEILEALPHAGTVTVAIVIIGEYTSPKYRGFLLTMKSASILWGIWAANTIGTFLHWKYIPLLGIIFSLYSLTVFFWPESPYWLAKQGRYEQCRKSHRWLKGVGEDAERELEALIDSQTEKPKNRKLTLKFVTAPEFYKPTLISIVSMLMYQFSGKQVYSTYAIDIIKKITDSETAGYNGMLILDGVSVIGIYIGCSLASFLRRRTLLFSSGFTSAFFLFAMSLYLFLIKLSYFAENKYVSISLLVGFSVALSLGPLILATSLYGELIPLEFKSQAVIIIPICFVTVQSTLLRIAPYFFKCIGMHGMFFFYAVCLSVCLGLLFKYLPEIKDKTLQEIEEYFKKK